jgi:hypothetical protein
MNRSSYVSLSLKERDTYFNIKTKDAMRQRGITMGKFKQESGDRCPTPEQEKKLSEAIDTIVEGFGPHDTLKIISVLDNMLGIIELLPTGLRLMEQDSLSHMMMVKMRTACFYAMKRIEHEMELHEVMGLVKTTESDEPN